MQGHRDYSMMEYVLFKLYNLSPQRQLLYICSTQSRYKSGYFIIIGIDRF